MGEDSDLSYAVPKEGTNVFVDNMCILKDAPHPENAYAFINHILNPQVEAEICNTIHYATPNAAARKLLPSKKLTNPTIYSPNAVIVKSEPILDVGGFTIAYDRA